jgi:hypothetical protein
MGETLDMDTIMNARVLSARFQDQLGITSFAHVPICPRKRSVSVGMGRRMTADYSLGGTGREALSLVPEVTRNTIYDLTRSIPSSSRDARTFILSIKKTKF